MRVDHYVLNDLGFKKKWSFPVKERNKIVKAGEGIDFKSLKDYMDNFEETLEKQLADSYTADVEKCMVFKNIKSRTKNGSFNYQVDIYNPKLRIAIEVEKTKETTLLLDVIKFIIGYKREWEGESIIKYGVFIIPENQLLRQQFFY